MSAAFRAERIKEVGPIQTLQRCVPKIAMSSSPPAGLLVWTIHALLVVGIMGWLVAKFDLGPRAFLQVITEVKLTV